MIENDIVSKMDSSNPNDFRWLMYLARNGAWVNVAGDTYHIAIMNRNQSIERAEGDTIYYDNEIIPISAEDENKYKLILSKLAMRIFITSSSKGTSELTAEKNQFGLPDLQMDIKKFDYLRTSISLAENRSINLHISITNFDYEFCQKLTSATHEERKKLVSNYKSEREAAFHEADKNEIWLAASSGDSQQLSRLLDIHKTINLTNECYNGKNILQSIFDFQPGKDIPFSEIKKPNWEETIQLLKDKAGLDLAKPFPNMNNQTGFDLCNYHQHQINNRWFFQSPNPSPIKIFWLRLSVSMK